MRKTELANGEYYHIFNRGTDKREIFSCPNDYLRFLTGMREFNDDRPAWKVKANEVGPRVVTRGPTSNPSSFVSIVAYCLNSNHFHFILRQEKEKGVTEFMRKIGTGYTMYFNKKYNRSGVLFQGKFKAVHIASNEKLLLLSVYVSANHFIHGYSNQGPTSSSNSRSDLESNLESTFWPYASLPDYLGKRSGTLCDKLPILGQFKNISEYAKFTKDNALHLKEKKELEKMILE